MMNALESFTSQEYQYGFQTDIETDVIAKGLSEDVIRLISEKKGEPAFMLEFRLNAYRQWLAMVEPDWAHVHYPPIDYQAISYYAAPKNIEQKKSLDEVDPELLATFDKLGIPLMEQKRLAGVAVDAVFDSVSVATTFKKDLAKHGVIFCSFSEAVHEHPDLIQKYLGSVVPVTDNYFAALNSAVFTDGSFVYIPPGVTCPMDLSTYFRINTADSGQFERTLIIADKGSKVSYLEGCTAPKFDTNQLHAAVVELVALEDASNTPPSKTGLRATPKPARAASTTLSPSVASVPGRVRASRGRRLRPARPSPGSTPAVFCWGTTRWASSTRSP
jgi:Fe-S cluster assembly protein SufB